MSDFVLAVCVIIMTLDLVSNIFILCYRHRWEEMKQTEINILNAIRGMLADG